MTVTEYNRCVDAFSDNIYRFSLRNVKDVNTAKDIVQETYMRLWQRVSEVDFTKVKSYLFTTAYHLIVDLHRKNKRSGDFEEVNTEEYSHTNHYSDLKEILEKAVSTLPEIQRVVVLLRDYEGYSYEEIGKITDLNESQVKVYIFRARKKLKVYLMKIGVTV